MVISEQGEPAALLISARSDRVYDTELWMHLLPLCRELPPGQEKLQDDIFAEALRQYPTSLFVWTQHIAFMLTRFEKSDDASLPDAQTVSKLSSQRTVESLKAQLVSVFEKAAEETLSPQIWDHYLTWLQGPRAETAPGAIEELYERAVSEVGLDIHAVNLWMGYIRFVKEKKVLYFADYCR